MKALIACLLVAALPVAAQPQPYPVTLVAASR